MFFLYQVGKVFLRVQPDVLEINAITQSISSATKFYTFYTNVRSTKTIQKSKSPLNIGFVWYRSPWFKPLNWKKNIHWPNSTYFHLHKTISSPPSFQNDDMLSLLGSIRTIPKASSASIACQVVFNLAYSTKFQRVEEQTRNPYTKVFKNAEGTEIDLG